MEKAFRARSAEVAETIDLLELVPGTFHPLLQSGYTGMLNKFPAFYHCLYDWTHQHRLIRHASCEVIEKMGWTIRKKLRQVFRDIRPTRIVSTHPFSLLMCPTDQEPVKTVGVLTDYELHPIWLVRAPQVLCVPRALPERDRLEKVRWKTGCRLVETGIPVDPSFYREVSRDEAKRRLGLIPDLPVVLVMGGGTGMGPMEQLVQELSRPEGYQVAVLTGKNEALLRKLRNKISDPLIRLEGYREDIPLWMSAADLLVTKPGGLTISEAIAKRLPMLLFEAFPGQEEANQHYLLHHRVAMITRPSTVRIQVNKFFSPRYKRKEMRERFSALQAENAADWIVRETLSAGAPVLQTL
ncbi:MGDG synthase family glycosyltransferase [Staphylospora marina]|uniref:MGDG synthase family glycosyltransferase n=1 Tax=Staphylospora marina TaxID=2490858 RepID=UPI0013DDBFA0|nr:glycosyltransferase [Staphylospora marina]